MKYKIFHWDTFDNKTLEVGEANTLEKAEEIVKKRYGVRISTNGADRVDIVEHKTGKVAARYSVC